MQRRIAAVLSPEIAGVHGRVVATDGGWRLDLELVTIGGDLEQRAFTAARCDTLAEATIVIAGRAGAASQSTVDSEPAAPGAEPPSAAVEPVDRPAPIPAPEAAAPRTTSPAFGVVGVGAGVRWPTNDAVPDLSFEIGGGLQRRRVRADVAIEGGAHVARRRLGVDVGAAALRPRVCAVAGLGRFVELLPCASVAVGFLRGRGRGVVGARTSTKPTLAIGVETVAIVKVRPRWGVFVGISGRGQVLRPRFALGTGQVLYQTLPFVVGVRAGIEIRLGGTGRKTDRATP